MQWRATILHAGISREDLICSAVDRVYQLCQPVDQHLDKTFLVHGDWVLIYIHVGCIRRWTGETYLYFFVTRYWHFFIFSQQHMQYFFL